MYNYGAPGFNRPPGFSGPPPGMAPPPGMGPPAGSSGPPAPGITPPPGVGHAQPSVLGGPRSLPPNWQPPTNMPNINFNAPVIHFGTSGSARGAALDGSGGRRESAAPGGRRGLGMDGAMRDADQGQKARDLQASLVPPSREEIARTIFIGNIPDGVGGDEGMQRILATAGNLRRWTRCTDAKNKPCTFGFAEYEDAESLETAADIFQDVQVPAERQVPSKVKKEEATNGDVKMEDGEEKDEVKKTKLQVVVDDASKLYAEEWKSRRGDDEATTQFRIHTAKEALAGVLASLFNPQYPLPMDLAADTVMHDTQAHENGEHAEIVTIQFSADDELADIPEEMRETVAAEIAAFRDRANQRDQERLALEEKIEAEERIKNRSNRLASPPASAPIGPAGANGVPLGPRAERGIQGAPSGPRGGSQFPSDYQAGVAFVNGSGTKNGAWSLRDDDDDPASDEEIMERRQEQRRNQLDREFKAKERGWMNREGKTVASLRRVDERHTNKEEIRQRNKEAQASLLRTFDDTIEMQQKNHVYYSDHGAWTRARNDFLAKEVQEDAIDRAQEDVELAAWKKQREAARGMADAFLDQQAEELLRPQAPREPQRFKLSLGAAAKKVEEAAATRRTAAEIENLLEDEEDADAPIHKRPLVPIKFDPSIRANLTSEEIAEAQQQLAREIPNDKEGLWKWAISWNDLPEKNISKDIKDWAEKKIVESLGVQEDMLVDAIVDHIREKKGPQDLVEELSEFLEDDAEQLVKKLWRMVIYYSESEKRGIK
ncbi:uncharacterized protein BDR25DRAFT_253252 [Lindgomyces ingoldianus]|uniref:Uncharacterized protein n=1 Tax=Lindgomyces ingoldianus TaxID=673940 RepID=A0ACB6RBL4_9PLEO|nr:uncharacterized protein BDR25DRAFT_253252 [Lindgomyces ingoldianus]KAF2475730.1 hypothetical protein BDR25DRAFT_253252 [Lindgomyces ingoldianus]